jgi:photosynthetic reaction center cytochrome c subunit
MSTNRLQKLVCGIGLTLLLSLLVIGRTKHHSLADPADGQAASRDLPAEQVYKNIQVMKGVAAAQLPGAMSFMSASLGVGCSYCHTDQWESDEKPAKQATRSMILLTDKINRDGFGGSRSVSCNTCHQGRFHTDPVPAPMGEPHSELMPRSNPPAADVVARYTKAIGGSDAIAKMTSRVSRGTRTVQNIGEPGVSASVEVQQTAQNKFLSITASAGSILLGFDGSQGWGKTPTSTRVVAGEELSRLKQLADFFRFLKIAETYPQMRTLGTQRVRGRDAYAIGATSREGNRETLFFDIQNGLLLRISSNFRTVYGSIPEITDFDDYRDVGGIKLPFTERWSRAPFADLQRFDEVKINVSVRDSIFNKPN